MDSLLGNIRSKNAQVFQESSPLAEEYTLDQKEMNPPWAHIEGFQRMLDRLWEKFSARHDAK